MTRKERTEVGLITTYVPSSISDQMLVLESNFEWIKRLHWPFYGRSCAMLPWDTGVASLALFWNLTAPLPQPMRQGQREERSSVNRYCIIEVVIAMIIEKTGKVCYWNYLVWKLRKCEGVLIAQYNLYTTVVFSEELETFCSSSKSKPEGFPFIFASNSF